MKKWRYLFIAAVLIYSTYLLIPTARFYAMSSDKRKSLSETQRDKYVNSTIKLGLDLQGGMHLVVEIDDSKSRKSFMVKSAAENLNSAEVIDSDTALAILQIRVLSDQRNLLLNITSGLRIYSCQNTKKYPSPSEAWTGYTH